MKPLSTKPRYISTSRTAELPQSGSNNVCNGGQAQYTGARTLIQEIFQFSGQALFLFEFDELGPAEFAYNGLRKRIGQTKRHEIDSAVGFPVRQVSSVSDSAPTHGANGRVSGFSAQDKNFGTLAGRMPALPPPG